MTTVPRMRSAIRVAADCAMADAPTDIDARVRTFVARLSGAMQHLEEVELDAILWALLQSPAVPVVAARRIAPDLAAWASKKLSDLSSTN